MSRCAGVTAAVSTAMAGSETVGTARTVARQGSVVVVVEAP